MMSRMLMEKMAYEPGYKALAGGTIGALTGAGVGMGAKYLKTKRHNKELFSEIKELNKKMKSGKATLEDAAKIKLLKHNFYDEIGNAGIKGALIGGASGAGLGVGKSITEDILDYRAENNPHKKKSKDKNA